MRPSPFAKPLPACGVGVGNDFSRYYKPVRTFLPHRTTLVTDKNAIV